jgi:hypothetical protein
MKILKNIFSKKEIQNETQDSELKGGVKLGVRPTEAFIKNMEDMMQRSSSKVKETPSIELLNDLSDLLYGPESSEYIKELIELNKKFKKRESKFGEELIDPSIEEKRKEKERSIIDGNK